jgi:hypothetical protein
MCSDIMRVSWPYYHLICVFLDCVTSGLASSLAVFYTFIYSDRKREVEILEKKFEQKCQQLETVQADNKNLELKVEQLKHEQVVCVVQKSTVTLIQSFISPTNAQPICFRY